MPFTFAHPAAVVPVHRIAGRYTSLSALVIGSMVPDAPQFLPLWISREQSHSLGGTVWFCLPVGLVAYLVFHGLVKRPAVDLMPGAIRSRLAATCGCGKGLGDADWLVVAASLWAGALTHLLWDGFTHQPGKGAWFFPGIDSVVLAIGDYQLRLYKALQYGSTVVGMALLAWWSLQWLARQELEADAAPSPLSGRLRLLVLAVMVVVCIVVAGLVVGGATVNRLSVRSWRRAVVRVAVTGIATFGACLVAYAAVWTLWDRKQKGRRRAAVTVEPATLEECER